VWKSRLDEENLTALDVELIHGREHGWDVVTLDPTAKRCAIDVLSKA
jgi:hypothetical protein